MKSTHLKFSDRFYDCTFLVSGYDTIEESASVFIFEQTWAALESAKQYAKERNTGSNQAYTTKLGGMEFQIKPHGGDGVTFLLSNSRFTVAIRPAKVAYNLSITYRSRTLWEYGAQEARKMIWDALLREMKPRAVEDPETGEMRIDAWRRLSRVDYAFDFHAPEMTDEIGPEMLDRMVCHSSSKVRWDFKIQNEDGEQEAYVMGTSSRIQTLTVGKKGSLQLQLYKKSDEITEKSQKTWMHKLWNRAGLEPDGGAYDDVWRIELRYGREYLGKRGIDTFEDFDGNKEQLICEGLEKRRMTDRTRDTNRRRWPLHPMWSQAIELAGNVTAFIPLDGHKERAAERVEAKIKQDIKAAIRRMSVLKTGGSEYDWMTAHNFMAELMAEIEDDENHEQKMEEYGERYKYVYEPV